MMILNKMMQLQEIQTNQPTPVVLMVMMLVKTILIQMMMQGMAQKMGQMVKTMQIQLMTLQ